MSTGISIASEPNKEIDGYFQNFAGEFENINFLLKKDDCDLSSYLYCPESWEDEEDMKGFGSSDEDIAYMKLITTEEYHPISEVVQKVNKTIELANGYDEEVFEYGKEGFLADLRELGEELSKHSKDDLKILFCRA